MAGFVFFLVLVALGTVLWRIVLSRRRPRVHDAEGRRLFPSSAADVSAWIAGGVLPLVLIVLVASSIRVVPVGQALVIFNTVTRGFRVAQQGITFVPPFISSTAK